MIDASSVAVNRQNEKKDEYRCSEALAASPNVVDASLVQETQDISQNLNNTSKNVHMKITNPKRQERAHRQQVVGEAQELDSKKGEDAD